MKNVKPDWTVPKWLFWLFWFWMETQMLQVGDSLWEPPRGHINIDCNAVLRLYQKYNSYWFTYHLDITFHPFCGKLMPCTVFYWTLRPAGKNIESRPANEATKGVYFVLLCASKTLVPKTLKYPYNWLKTWSILPKLLFSACAFCLKSNFSTKK